MKLRQSVKDGASPAQEHFGEIVACFTVKYSQFSLALASAASPLLM